MRILLIKLKHIGDSLLLTPTIVAIKEARPEAEIWVVLRRGCEGILAGCPEIDRLLTVAPVEKHERNQRDFWRTLGVLLRLAATPFDDVFELGDGHRGRLLARAARTQHRYTVRTAEPLPPREARHFTAMSSFAWEARHRVEKDFYTVAEFLPLPEPIPPLRFDRAAAQLWAPAEYLADFAIMHIGKRQTAGRWSRDGWEEVGRWLLDHVANLIISSGPAEAETEDAIWLCDRLGPRARATLGRADWPQMADLLYRARLYLGTDTATMHLAAACGCPIVALFGATWEKNWRPWQARSRLVAESEGEPFSDPVKNLAHVRTRTMAGIAPASVIAACAEMLHQKPPSS
jgi:heptosyltransferase-3